MSRHPDDPRARVARLYLAWVYIQRGELARARSLVAATEGGPLGSAQDFAVVTEAAIAERQGAAKRALSLLGPLAGKIVDSDERAMFDELYIRAAVGAKQWKQALQGMVEWLAEALPEEQEVVRAAVREAMQRLPASALEQALVPSGGASPVGASSARSAAREWMSRAARERLAGLALEGRDAALARRLLEASSSARVGESDAALSRLAAGNAVVPRVAGRVVGLALSLGHGDAQRRSAQVAMGMSRALGLPAAQREDGVRLVIRDDGGDADAFERTLAELAGDGAVILVAGVDDRDAERAAAYANRSALPIIVLGKPASPPRQGSYAFLLGMAAEPTVSALRTGLQARGASAPAEVGPGGAPCDAQAPMAGEPRFPVKQWKTDRVDAVLLLGDANCTRDALSELNAAGVKPLLALGFESAELFDGLLHPRAVLSAASGSFPYREQSAPADMRRWAQTSGGGPRWYEALGHDAARLASAALDGFPAALVEDSQAVARLHRQARARLLSASAELWTSERRGFAGRQAIERRVEVLAKGSEHSR